MKNIDVSIVIRTLNEAKYLGRLLDAIESQRGDFQAEVIIVDSGSTDATLAIANAHSCIIKHINRADFSFGRSLNIGCEAANGEFLVFVSGHCIPCHGSWLQRLVEPLDKGLADYTYGRQLGSASTYWSENQIFAKHYPSESRLPQTGYFCNNANSAIKRSIWEAYRFDETLTGLEDLHLAKKIISDGYSLGYIAEASVFHIHEEMWHQVQRRFEREALALKAIAPEVILRKRDVIKYISAAVVADLWAMASANNRLDLREAATIFQYRVAQFVGSYKGNRFHKKLTTKLKESYFYPSTSEQPVLGNLPILNTQQQTMSTAETKPKVIALLPMKGHSARVSGKNFRDFCGKPLFRWVLDTLLSVDEIDQVVINTDARELLLQNGLTADNRIIIRDRPKEICGDFVSMNLVIQDDLLNTDGDLYLMTHTTNPLLSKETITASMDAYYRAKSAESCDSLFTANRIQTRFYRRDGSPVNHDPNVLVRTQDLEAWYEENSNLYIFTKESFAETKARIGRSPSIYVTPKHESVDIDEPEDWEVATRLVAALQSVKA
jgi:CMP-N-acetylneuraminic acid synthetase/glycosyltransferase involved in cell wall biosynthesis